MAATLTKEQRVANFIERLKKLYPDYTLASEYENADTMVVLKHKDGYIWNVKPRYLDGVRQCKEVGRANIKRTVFKLDKETWQERLDEKFGKGVYIIKGEYKTSRDPIDVLHTECGKIFKPSLDNLIKATKGCSHCYGKTLKSLEEIKAKVASIDSEYEVQSVIAKHGHMYMTCKHNNERCGGHVFNMRVSDFVSKHEQRCPMCKVLDNESKASKRITKYLDDNGYKYVKEYRCGAKDKAELPYDFYLEDYNLLIEYDGIQHYEPCFLNDYNLEDRKAKDQIKTNYAKENGYNFVRIKYTQDEIKVLEKKLNPLVQKTR